MPWKQPGDDRLPWEQPGNDGCYGNSQVLEDAGGQGGGKGGQVDVHRRVGRWLPAKTLVQEQHLPGDHLTTEQPIPDSSHLPLLPVIISTFSRLAKRSVWKSVPK